MLFESDARLSIHEAILESVDGNGKAVWMSADRMVSRILKEMAGLIEDTGRVRTYFGENEDGNEWTIRVRVLV